MKQFIVTAAVLPLLIAFLVAFGEIQEQNVIIAAIDDTVYAAKELARQEGCFSEKVQDYLRSQLCKRIKGLKENDVIIGSKTDTVPVFRAGLGGSSGLIRYQVSVAVPAGRSGKLIGVRQRENKPYYVIDSFTVSEYVPAAGY